MIPPMKCKVSFLLEEFMTFPSLYYTVSYSIAKNGREGYGPANS